MGIYAFRGVISHTVSHNQFDTYIISSGIVYKRSEGMSAIVGQVFHFQFSHAGIEITIHVSAVSVVISELVIDKVYPGQKGGTVQAKECSGLYPDIDTLWICL